MIKGFKHKGLKLLYTRGDERKLNQYYVRKIKRILFVLDNATCPTDMDLPGFNFHQLSGDLKNHWSVLVSANWRIIFRFENGDAYDVELIDYH